MSYDEGLQKVAGEKQVMSKKFILPEITKQVVSTFISNITDNKSRTHLKYPTKIFLTSMLPPIMHCLKNRRRDKRKFVVENVLTIFKCANIAELVAGSMRELREISNLI